MDVDVKRLRELRALAYSWPPSNFDAFAEACEEALPELLRVYEAVMGAPEGRVPLYRQGSVVKVVSVWLDEAVPADQIGQRVRLVATHSAADSTAGGGET